MATGEIAFLSLAIGAAVIFAVTLVWVSKRCH